MNILTLIEETIDVIEKTWKYPGNNIVPYDTGWLASNISIRKLSQTSWEIVFNSENVTAGKRAYAAHRSAEKRGTNIKKSVIHSGGSEHWSNYKYGEQLDLKTGWWDQFAKRIATELASKLGGRLT